MTKFGLCSAWVGNGGVFDFDGTSIVTEGGVTQANLLQVYQTIKTISQSVGNQAFPSSQPTANEYSKALFEFMAQRLSIQTSGGLKVYLMVGGLTGTLAVVNGAIRLLNETDTDVTNEYKTAVIWAAQACEGSLGSGYGVLLFKSLLEKILI